jgi:hypothetical protein
MLTSRRLEKAHIQIAVLTAAAPVRQRIRDGGGVHARGLADS